MQTQNMLKLKKNRHPEYQLIMDRHPEYHLILNWKPAYYPG